MKNIAITIIALIFTLTVSAAPVITLVQNNGNWNNPGAWNLNRLPMNNDTVNIPLNLTVTITTNINLNNLYVKAYGKLKFSGGKLNLNNSSEIYVFVTGMITGSGNNDRIKIGNNDKFRGTDAPVTGPSFANSLTGNGFDFLGLLPVKFTNFNVAQVNNAIEINWSASEDLNNVHFEVQKSMDGRSWKTIATVNAATTFSPVNHYRIKDYNVVSGTNYFRVKQVDKDGHATFTSIESIHAGKQISDAKIYVSSPQTVSVALKGLAGKIVIKVYTLNGRPVTEKSFQASDSIQMIVPAANPGIYIIQVVNGSHHVTSGKVIL